MPEALTLAEGATAEGEAAVAGIAAASPAAHVAGMAAVATPAPLLERQDAGWRVGRYAGQLTLDGRSVLLEPRIGWDALDGWVMAATGLPVPATTGVYRRARVTALASMLWVCAVDGASRHGPPAFRRDVPYEGGNVRGRLDVRRTVRLRAKGASTAASVYRARELDNPVTRIIVAADRVLMRQVSDRRWRTDRVDGVLAQLQTAVGRRSPAPPEGELHRMRYTPITRPFKWAAELSSRIVRQDPVATTALPGRVQGLVIDLDGVYAGAALGWAREARPDLRADVDGSGQVVLRDHQRIRASLDPNELPPDAADAAVAVARALAGI